MISIIGITPRRQNPRDFAQYNGIPRILKNETRVDFRKDISDHVSGQSPFLPCQGWQVCTGIGGRNKSAYMAGMVLEMQVPI